MIGDLERGDQGGGELQRDGVADIDDHQHHGVRLCGTHISIGKVRSDLRGNHKLGEEAQLREPTADTARDSRKGESGVGVAREGGGRSGGGRCGGRSQRR